MDQPLSIRRCRQTGRDYLLCDYNRDGDSYRSPWSNEFDPPLEGGPGSAASLPSEKVRRMEVRANEAFDLYRDLYYEGGVSSVYFWNLDDGFAGVVLLKKGKLRFYESSWSLDMLRHIPCDSELCGPASSTNRPYNFVPPAILSREEPQVPSETRAGTILGLDIQYSRWFESL